MKKILFSIIILISSSYALEIDKQKHMLVSVMIANKTKSFSNKKTALFTSISIGVAKEIVDSMSKNNNFSYGDLIADIVGSYIGVYGPKNLGLYTINSKSSYGIKLKF
jgi:uncharacterized protein YfiM (DUF2279 family)